MSEFAGRRVVVAGAGVAGVACALRSPDAGAEVLCCGAVTDPDAGWPRRDPSLH